MSAPTIAVPGSVQRNQTITPSGNDTTLPQQQQQQQQEIANLAYALWQRRGSPDGSPEQDWQEAERILQTQSTTNRFSR
jgi:hypothetical protein